jgi:hypothetical protein
MRLTVFGVWIGLRDTLHPTRRILNMYSKLFQIFLFASPSLAYIESSGCSDFFPASPARGRAVVRIISRDNTCFYDAIYP